MSKFHDEFFRKGSKEHDKLVEQTISSIKDIFKEIIFPNYKNKITDSYELKLIDVELEKICKNGTFILGYVDIQAIFHLKYLNEDCYNISYYIFVVIECKPDLSTWGGPLRQIKTYMDSIEHNGVSGFYPKIVVGLFSTYDVVSDSIKELFKKENIFVATLPKLEEI